MTPGKEDWLEDYIKAKAYETFIPQRFALDDGEVKAISSIDLEETLIKEPLFLPYVPSPIDDLYHYLKREEGFKDVALTIHKGEKFSIRKVIEYPWELHLRIFEGGFIEAEVEVQREFLEHLGERRLFVVYEPFGYYRGFYKSLHMLYKPKGRWIVNVLDHFRVRLNPPQSLTPWKPVVATVVGIAAVGILLPLLSRLSKR